MIKSHRIDRIREALTKHGIDALLVLIEENRRYLSGFTGEDTQFDESAGALIISADKLVLATDSRYDLQARHEAEGYQVICYKESLAHELPEIARQMSVKRIGFESVRMTIQQYDKIKKAFDEAGTPASLIPTEEITERLRVIKDDTEIQQLKSALKIAESAWLACLQDVIPGMRESEIAWLMEKRLRESGADALSFPSIVASGPNGALPHAIPGDRRIKTGEPILFDWGVKLNGYCSDISRTVCFGQPDDTFRRVFQTVLEAQQMAIEAIKPGASSKQVDKIARDHIDSSGFKGKFGHGLGHGTGLAIHEAPRLSPLKDIMLEPGMVTTVEPGIYLPDWGGVRLENMIVVTENGAEVLNTHDPSDVAMTL